MSEKLKVRLARGSEAEARTGRSLRRLQRRYALEPWLWTREVMVDEQGIPHSHPLLTLNTTHADNELMLLAELVHEQLHWFEEAHADARDRAIEATRALFPQVPIDRPEGAGSEASTRLHLLVCTLEHDALRHLASPQAARLAIEALSRHHYCWVYRTVLDHTAPLRRLLRVHGLWPPALASMAEEGG